MSDLIEQLRALSAYEHDDASIGEEAAAEIERLTAENKRLTNIIAIVTAYAVSGYTETKAIQAELQQDT
jgi:hypothetical protein